MALTWLVAILRAVPWQAWAFVAAVIVIWIAIDQFADGRVSRAVQTITEQNTEAKDAADKARQGHDADCAHGRPECLQDGWTRDGGR